MQYGHTVVALVSFFKAADEEIRPHNTVPDFERRGTRPILATSLFALNHLIKADSDLASSLYQMCCGISANTFICLT